MSIGIVFLAAFLALMIVIGVWGMKKTKTLGDFFLGGRTMGPWVSAVAYGTSYFSAVIFIGFAGTQGWQFGLNALWIALGNALIGAMAAWFILARRTRRMTQNLDTMTMPEFLQERYGAKHLKPVAASVIFFFLLPYSASVFKGLGHLFEAVFHIPYDLALLIMIAFTGVYLILGGYFAIAITDFIQGIIMFFGAIAMVSVLTGNGRAFCHGVKGERELLTTHSGGAAAKRAHGYLAGVYDELRNLGPAADDAEVLRNQKRACDLQSSPGYYGFCAGHWFFRLSDRRVCPCVF